MSGCLPRTHPFRIASSTAIWLCLQLLLGTAVSGASSQAQKNDPGERRPGGTATSRGSLDNRNAFSHPSANLGFSKEFDFKIGNALFRKLWVSSPSSTRSSDGLGPLFNARSCQRCHLKDGRGHPPSANWPDDNAVSMILRLSIPPKTEAQRQRLASGRANVIAEPTYGMQLQDLAIQGHAGEGRMHVTYREREVKLADGEIVSLREPQYRITDLSYGPLHPETMVSPRIAPQMIGLGLLEAISETAILANADPNDENGDGISGRPNRVWSIEENKLALGRFGWKAGAPTILQQTADAFAGDIGISSKLVPKPFGDCTEKQLYCRNAPNGESKRDREIKNSLLNLVAFYSRNLAVPRLRNPDGKQVLRGEQLFGDIGCAECHVPTFKTGNSHSDENLNNQIIWPYSDLLLHNMGEGLADGRPEGRASGQEWRTAPLWGIGLTETVSGHSFFLHDGRARNLQEAILWHGGEAEGARIGFSALSKVDRERLIAFLKSL
ncbi:MAG: di-heme oxidoredictase family protein [Hyphomicrobiaceae bacterium]